MARTLFKIKICTLLVLTLVCTAPALPNGGAGVPADTALFRLMEGNARFVANRLQPKHYDHERPELAKGQQPYAIVLACADSRVPPELVFDETLGRLFVIRVAGHVAEPAVLGSVEYAVEHLGAHLLFVLGHESCGAVKATIAGGEAPPNIASLLTRISPAVDKTRARKVEERNMLDASIAENVRYQMQMSLFESEVLSEAVRHKKLAVAGGVYRLQSGRVELIPASVAVEHGKPAESHDETASDDAHHAPQSSDKHGASHTSKPTPKREAEGDAHEGGKRPAAHGSEKPARRAPAHEKGFAKLVRAAYEQKTEVRLRKSMLMRDAHDRCATADCKSVPAGEVVEVISPAVLDVMGRQQIRVKYKGRVCYVLADERAFEFDAE